ncbi:MAG: hypothetical protein JF590_09025 [Gemmatimonadetes bacterium]|nr:hypothetical protein [Gemmatimonadota bacterium]
MRDLASGVEQTFDVGRDVEYFDVSDGPWVGLRYRRPVHAGEHRPWGQRLHAPCGGDDGERGPTEVDAWLDVSTGAIRSR